MSLPEFKFALKMKESLPVLESFERVGALLVPLNVTNFYVIPLYTTDIDIIELSSWEELAQWVRSTLLPDDDFIAFSFLWPTYKGIDVAIYIEPESVKMDCHAFALIYGEEAFFDQFSELAKSMAVSFPTDFAVGAWEGWFGEDWIDESLKNYDIWGQLETNFALTYIPTYASNLRSTYDQEYSVLPSFIILSRERYEASKPYIPKMPVKFHPFRREPILRVPKKPVIKRIEELSSGVVFLFINYPLNFEAVRRLKKKGYWKELLEGT
jgi:hypothetical protein